MAKEIGSFDAKTHLSQLLEQVLSGHSFIITRHGKPVAQLTPLKPEETKTAMRGCAKGKPGTFYMAEDFDAPLEDFREYQ